MIVSREQIAGLNFGYLNGSDLLQFCPDQMLIKSYAVDPNKLQIGCNQAYGYVKAKLCNRYDINAVISNANQLLRKVTGSIQVSIAAGTYISRIDFRSFIPDFNQIALNNPTISGGTLGVIDIFPLVTIGTTSGGNDVLQQINIENGYLWFANRYFASATTLYFTISGPEIDINIAASTGITMPPIYVNSLLNKSEDFTVLIPANTYVYQMFAEILLDTPSIKVGTTLGGSEILVLTLIPGTGLTHSFLQYFATDTILYFHIEGGSTNIRLDEGFNFVAPPVQPYLNKDDVLTQILAIRAIKNILGADSGTSDHMKNQFLENEEMIHEIQTEMMGLTLPSPNHSINAIPYTVQSNFKTIG